MLHFGFEMSYKWRWNGGTSATACALGRCCELQNMSAYKVPYVIGEKSLKITWPFPNILLSLS